MEQMIREFSSFGPVAFLWFARILWLCIGTIGAYESTKEYVFNLRRHRRYRHTGGAKEIIARGRYWRSFWFLTGFLICFLTGLMAVSFLFVAAPPRPDVTVQSTILTLLLEFMIICFWLAKHADRQANKEAEAFARSHQSMDNGDLLGEQPKRPHGA